MSIFAAAVSAVNVLIPRITALAATMPTLPTMTETAADVAQMVQDVLATMLTCIGGVVATVVGNPFLFFVIVIPVSLGIVNLFIRLANIRA